MRGLSYFSWLKLLLITVSSTRDMTGAILFFILCMFKDDTPTCMKSVSTLWLARFRNKNSSFPHLFTPKHWNIPVPLLLTFRTRNGWRISQNVALLEETRNSFERKVTFELLMDFKQNYYGNWKYTKAATFKSFLHLSH